jgi:hypothetical protein
MRDASDWCSSVTKYRHVYSGDRAMLLVDPDTRTVVHEID